MLADQADAKYLERISSFFTIQQCEQFAVNARVRGREDLAIEAEKKAIELAPNKLTDADNITRECIQAIHAYERSKTTSTRKFRASRTWQMFERHGAVGTIERSVTRSNPTMGYEALRDAGFEDYAFENIVLRHPEHFSQECRERAAERIDVQQSRI